MPESPRLDAAAVRLDTAAVRWSAPSSELATRPLLVLMHGYGSHEADLFSLIPALPDEPVVASVRAPLIQGPGHAWWPLGTNPGEPDASLVDAATSAVIDWLDTLPEASSIGLMGFSQGGAMTLQLLRRAPERFAYAVQLSGFVAGESGDGDDALAVRKPPVFWGRGDSDPIIPDSAIARTATWLSAHATLTERVYAGLPHAISQPELEDVAAFISAQL